MITRFTCLCLFALFSLASYAQEPYAVLNDEKTVLTFYYDTQKESRNGMDVGPFELWWDMGWNSYRQMITSVVFDSSFSGCTSITSTADWFWNFSNLTSITGIENLKTENVTDMNRMFGRCSSLTSLDVSGFNTGKVIDMGMMFYDCSSLTNLDLSNFNTKNVTSAGRMFQGCSSLVSLDVSNWSNDKITDMSTMFYYLNSLTNLNMSGFKTANVTNIARMFENCPNLKSLDLSSFETNNVTNMGGMFSNCCSLTSLDVSNFVTDNVTNMGNMFYGCSSLTSLDVSRFKTDNVTDMGYMFYKCSSLTSLDVSGFNTAKVQRMACMFADCSGLTSLDVSGFDTSNVTDIYQMFYGCSGLKSLDVSHFNTESVNGSYGMMGMFYQCSNLTSLNVSGFNTANVTDMRSMFSGCSSLTSLHVSSFNTANVTKMSKMFMGCSGLNDIDLNAFNTANVTEMDLMFYGCSGFTSLDLSSFNTENVESLYDMFWECSELKTIYVSDTWKMADDVNGTLMFHKCTSLVGGKGTTYDANHLNATYAHIDGGAENPGYLTDIEQKGKDLDPIEGETTVSTEGLGNEDLTDNVVDDIYYNVGDDGYDSTDGSIVIGETTNMGQIDDTTPGSNDIVNNFTGLILRVAAGKGTITVNVKTTGNAQLVVQVGNQTPMIATKTEQGDVVASYDVTEDTYVYIYAIVGSSAAPALRAAGTNVVKIYSITVTPGATGILSIDHSPLTIDHYYTLDGRKMKGVPAKKGIFIVNGRKVVMK